MAGRNGHVHGSLLASRQHNPAPKSPAGRLVMRCSTEEEQRANVADRTRRKTPHTSSSAEVVPMPSRVLISGATGMIGSLLTDALVARGAEFSVMFRPGHSDDRFTRKPGVTATDGDFDRPVSLRRALVGGAEGGWSECAW